MLWIRAVGPKLSAAVDSRTLRAGGRCHAGVRPGPDQGRGRARHGTVEVISWYRPVARCRAGIAPLASDRGARLLECAEHFNLCISYFVVCGGPLKAGSATLSPSRMLKGPS
jgi:hypothetical protein